MTDVQTGARAPDQQGPAQQAGQATKQAAGQVTETARQQTRQVAGEVATQARSVAADVRHTVTEQARTQNDRLADGIRQMAGELRQMADGRGDSPASTVVSRVADSGQQFADYLAQRGPEGVLREVQDFARRRPGAFLAATLAAGFVVGRLVKGARAAGSESAGGSTGAGQPGSVSGPGPAQQPPQAAETAPQLGDPRDPYPGAGRPVPPEPTGQGRLT